MNITDVAAEIAGRKKSVTRIVHDTLDRIERANARINAYITVLGEEALADARRLDEELAGGTYRGPLHGIPISVKDLIDVQGAPTTAASRVRSGHLAGRDAGVVSRLRAAGAVIVGKTNLHEFAYGTTSDESAYGAVRNPVAPDRSAGGSSGGSAAAIAEELCAGSVGTDTGGSIRIPSAACGVVGLKPTLGEVPTDGVVPLSQTLDHVGPMAADVAGAWLLYHAMVAAPVAVLDGRRVPSLSSLSFGVPRRYFLDLLDDEVRATFEDVMGRLRDRGVAVRDVDVPHAALASTVYLHLQLPESSCYHAASLESRPDLYAPSIRLRLEMGRYVLAEDYVRALRGREILRDEVDRALNGVDVLALPALAIPAPLLGQGAVTIEGRDVPVRAVMLRLTQLFNVTGHPAISLPCGVTSGRLPVGLQLVGRRDATSDVLLTAAAVEGTSRLPASGSWLPHRRQE